MTAEKREQMTADLMDDSKDDKMVDPKAAWKVVQLETM